MTRVRPRRLSAALGLCALALTLTQCARGAPPPAAIPGGDVRRGQEALREYGCSTCHTIPGVPGARGRVGPSLEGVAARLYLSGDLPNTPEQMMTWIENPRAIRPDTVMPVTNVAPDDLRHITAYLYRLR